MSFDISARYLVLGPCGITIGKAERQIGKKFRIFEILDSLYGSKDEEEIWLKMHEYMIENTTDYWCNYYSPPLMYWGFISDADAMLFKLKFL